MTLSADSQFYRQSEGRPGGDAKRTSGPAHAAFAASLSIAVQVESDGVGLRELAADEGFLRQHLGAAIHELSRSRRHAQRVNILTGGELAAGADHATAFLPLERNDGAASICGDFLLKYLAFERARRIRGTHRIDVVDQPGAAQLFRRIRARVGIPPSLYAVDPPYVCVVDGVLAAARIDPKPSSKRRIEMELAGQQLRARAQRNTRCIGR